jgi:hypothetical protein
VVVVHDLVDGVAVHELPVELVEVDVDSDE